MKKYEIVKEHKRFDEIIHDGRCIYNKCCLIYYKDSELPYPRFGIAVGKKIGNAVIRNKLKRQVRMILTSNKNLFKNGVDYIIIMKRSSLLLKFDKLTEQIITLIEK